MILLDYGHGQDTPGKRSGDLKEWAFNRSVGTFLELELCHRGIAFSVLVPEPDDVPLRERVQRAKRKGGDLLISIHGNAFRDSSVSGVETWYYSSEGKRVAKVFQECIVDATGWRDRGVKKGRFYILKHTPMTAILTENGFYTNPEEREKMMDPDWQHRIAMAHADAIELYETIIH